MGESQSDLIMHLTPVGCKDEFLKQNLFKKSCLKTWHKNLVVSCNLDESANTVNFIWGLRVITVPGDI